MEHTRISLRTCMLLALGLSLAGCTQNTNMSLGKFKETPCPFELPEGLIQGDNFKFGYVTVPEFHNKPNGKTIELAVAIFPSSSDNPKEPLVFNTGGPGESNMDNFIPPLAVRHSGRLGELVLPHRDAVVIELRGLRYSKPNLISDELVKARYGMLDKNLDEKEIMAIQVKALQATRDRLQRENVNLSAYNNVETAADIAMIMTNLGYEDFSLFGSSAGTILAQHVIRDYPEMVKCAILNGSVPIGTPFGPDMVPEAINSLKRIFNLCEEDTDCSEAFPDLEERFLNFLDSINQYPITIPIDVEGEEEKLNYVLTGSRFAGMIMLYMYFNPNVHVIIDQIMNGNYEFITQYIGFQSTMKTFADILGYSVFLSESPSFVLSDIQIDPAYSSFAKGVTCIGLGGEFLLAVDTIFSIDKIDHEIIIPDESSNVPILVLNGKYDPVIPVSYDEVLKARFERSYIYRFDGIAHSPVDFAEECAIKMFFEFIDEPSEKPEDLCVDEYSFTLQMK